MTVNRAIYIDAQAVRSRIAVLQLEYPELAEDAQLLADTLEGSSDLHEVLTEIVRAERDASAMAKAIREEEAALAERRARFERQKEAHRSLMLSLMEAAGQQKIVLPIATVSVSKGRVGCVITDEAALPEAFVKVERTPRKKEITDALASGQSVPGASLKNGSPSLMVRT